MKQLVVEKGLRSIEGIRYQVSGIRYQVEQSTTTILNISKIYFLIADR